MSTREIETLYAATRAVLGEWSGRLSRGRLARVSPRRSRRSARAWPCTAATESPVRTAARPVQRIVYAENESNYCPICQTGGKLLADRALSQLLRGDWPKTLEELEERKKGAVSEG